MSRATSFLRAKGISVSGSIEAAGLDFAITSSIISGSYGIPWFTSINPTGNQIVIVSNTPYQIGENSSSVFNPVFYVVNNTTEDLVGTANSNPTYTGSLNRLKGVTTRYTTTASALTAIVNDFLGQTNPEYSIVNFTYPSIPTRGLVGLFDAGFYSSYPKSSTKIFSIAGDLYNQDGIPRSGSISGVDVGLSYIPRGISGSLLLDNSIGTNLHIELSNSPPAYGPNGPSRYVTANGGTIAIWCIPTASVSNTSTAQMAILSNSGSDDGSGGYGFQMYLDSGVYISALAGQNNDPIEALIVNNDIPTGSVSSITTEPMFLAVTWNGTKTSGYFAQKDNNNGGNPFQIEYTPSSYPASGSIVYINRMGPGGNTNMYGEGIEFYAAYFYNTALTQDEINSLYNARIFQ